MKINYKCFMFFSLCLFISCNEKRKPSHTKAEVYSNFPKVINSKKTTRFTFDNEDPTWLTTALYEFNYIGKIKDSIVLENGIEFIPYNNDDKNTATNHLKYSVDLEFPPKLKYWDNAKIEIQISQNLVANSIPVLIRNNNKDTIAIGYGAQIPIIMEALNENYEWKPIQEKFVYSCGNGLTTIVLPPGEIVVTLAPNFKGFIKTKLRIVLGRNVSKPFWGFINKRQFESKFEGGDYKEEYKKENPNYNYS